MGKRKRKLSAAEKAEKRRRQAEFMTIFVRGKMKRVRRPPTIEGLSVEEFIRRNADPIWLLQNEMWECIEDGESSAPDAIRDFADVIGANDHREDDSCPF